MNQSIHKLEFLSSYGSDAHKAAIPTKVGHMVKKLNPEPDHNPYSDGSDSLASSKLVDGEHLHHLLNHPSKDVRAMAAGNPNVNGKHLDRMIKNGEHGQITQILHKKNPHLTSDHIHTILDHPSNERGLHPAGTIAYSHGKKLDDSHWDKIANHSNQNITQNGINSGHMPMHHLLHLALHHEDDHVRWTALEQRKERIANGEKD